MFYSKELMELQKQTLFSSKIFENFFSTDDYNNIVSIASELEKFEPVLHSGQTYTKFDYYNSKLHPILTEKMIELIGPHTVYLATIANTKGNPVLIHTDHNLADVSENALPYATLCIPLEVIGKNNEWGAASTITFDQYYFPEQDWEYRRHIFTDFLKPNTIKNASGFLDKTTITEEFYNQYLSQHSGYDFVDGMSVEASLTWKRNSLIIWHQCRFHCSDSYKNADTINKKSIILWTTKESK